MSALYALSRCGPVDCSLSDRMRDLAPALVRWPTAKHAKCWCHLARQRFEWAIVVTPVPLRRTACGARKLHEPLRAFGACPDPPSNAAGIEVKGAEMTLRTPAPLELDLLEAFVAALKPREFFHFRERARVHRHEQSLSCRNSRTDPRPCLRAQRPPARRLFAYASRCGSGSGGSRSSCLCLVLAPRGRLGLREGLVAFASAKCLSVRRWPTPSRSFTRLAESAPSALVRLVRERPCHPLARIFSSTE